MIPNIRGKPVTDIKKLKRDRVEFSGRAGPVEMVVKQPESWDIHRVLQGAKRCSHRTMKRYTMVGLPMKKPSEPKTICDYPPFKRGNHGYLFVIMLIRGEVVGFGRHYYCLGKELPMYKTPPDDMVAECALCIADPYQGKGLGTLYGLINKVICKDLGAKWLLGTTYTRGGMMKIRQRDGFDIVDILADGKQCRVRGRL